MSEFDCTTLLPASLHKGKDITGQKYGKLTVLGLAEHCPGKWSKWLCQCDCPAGTTVVAFKENLTKKGGHTTSCGCINQQRAKMFRYKHGLTGTPEFSSWRRMMARCYDSRERKYQDYGGRGITVHGPWHDAAVFVAGMGPKPTPKHEIDRINNDGNYEPGNCRWATRKEQMNNTRACHYLEHDGKRMTVTQWSEYLGWSRAMLFSRLQDGWDVARILTTPPKSKI